MVDMESKLKWAVKAFLLKDSIKSFLEINALADSIVNHAKYGKAFNSGEPITDVAYKVTVAYFRHKWTNYDELLRRGKDRSVNYRKLANDQARKQIRRWKKRKKDLVVKDI